MSSTRANNGERSPARPPSQQRPATIPRGPTQIVFLRLDPILQALLKEVTALKTVFDGNDVAAAAAASSNRGPSQWFRLVDAIVNHLDELARHFRSFGGCGGPSPSSSSDFGPSLVLLANYVTLPLTAIFHLQLPQKLLAQIARSTATTTTTSHSDNDNSELQRKIQIQQSYLRKLLAAAANAIRAYVEACSSASSETTSPQATHLGEPYLIKYLIALVSCLPSSAQVEQQQQAATGDSANGMVSPNGNLLLWQPPALSTSLEDGSDLWVSVLDAIHCILLDNYHHHTSWQTTLLEAWHGTLMMRLVDSATGFLLWQQLEPQQQRKQNSPATANLKSGFVFSSRVHVASINVLDCMLQQGATMATADTKSQSTSTEAVITFWQSVFPGVFTPLYRRIIGTSAVATSHRHHDRYTSTLEWKSIECVILLLRITLSDYHSSKASLSTETISTDNVLQQLSSLALRSNKNNTESGKEKAPTERDSKDSDTPASFFEQIQKRVVAPLSIILRHKAISKLERTRKEVLSLCHVVLIDTRSCCDGTSSATSAEVANEGDSSSNVIEEVALEICMALQQDPLDDIASRAKATIEEYTVETSDDKNRNTSSWMVPRIMNLVEKLPALLMGSGKQVEIKWELQKISGYIDCSQGSGLGSAALDSVGFRRALVQSMDIDLGSVAGKKNYASVLNDPDASTLRFRWLDSELESLAKRTVRGLGRTQKPKYAALFADEVLSDFFEASQQIPSTTVAYTEWLHKWVGSLPLARELIMGAFSSSKQDGLEKTSRKRKQNRILLSLASSVVPLVVNSDLWNLPTHEKQARNNGASEVTTRALEGNACITVLLLELIRTFFYLLEPEGLQSILPTALYPLVEKASQVEVDTIHEAATQALLTIATSLGRDTVADVICLEQSRLVAVMWGKLRLPGGSQTPTQRDASDVLTVATSLRWTLGSIIRATSKTRSDDLGHGNEKRGKVGFVDLVSLVEYRLDHLIHQKALLDEDFETLCGLHKSFFDYFLVSYDAEVEGVYPYKMRDMERSKKLPWLELLNQFRKMSSDKPIHEMAKGGAEERDSTRFLDVSQNDIDLFSRLIARNCYLLSSHTLKIRVSSCQGLTSGFKFLSFVGNVHKDTTDEQSLIRNSILRQVADSWPAIQARLMTLSEEIEAASQGTPSVSLVLGSDHSTPKSSGDANQVPIKRIFLANLFDLIAYLCECSGDFMADRFRNFVFPTIATQFRGLLHRQKTKQQRQRLLQESANATKRSALSLENESTTVASPSTSSITPRSLVSKSNSDDSFQWSDTERQLVLSMLRCLTRAFQQKNCGPALQPILGSVGTLVLPLLEVDNDIDVEGATMDCLKSILLIDCDILWRSLLELGCVGIPPCPLNITCSSKSVEKAATPSDNTLLATAAAAASNVPSSVNHESHLLAVRCRELLSFAESLAEQPII